MAQELDELGSLREHLLHRWVTWGIAPLVACAVITLLLASFAPVGPIEGKQAIRLAFEIVLGVGAAVFLAGFYIDGHWTDADRVARKIYAAAGGDERRTPASWAQSAAHRSALQSNAAIALASIRASADAITLMGAAIDLTAVVSVLMGLPTVHALQMLVLALCYQLFVFSRHPYYLELAEAALRGELLPREDAKATRAAKNPSN
jgi:hypothetical protein